MGMNWYQVGTASKELPEIGWRTNVFSKITAEPSLQAGLMANTRQSQKVWSLVESVIMITTQTTAVSGVTIYRSGTVGLSSCMSWKTRLLAISVTVVTAAEVICLVCYLTFWIWVVSYQSDCISYWYQTLHIRLEKLHQRLFPSFKIEFYFFNPLYKCFNLISTH